MDEEIYLDPNAPPPTVAPRRPGSGRQRLLAVVGLAVVIGVVVAVQNNRHHTSPTSAPVATPAPSNPADDLRPWPQGQGLCGTKLEVPLVTSQMSPSSTGAAITITGRDPGLADIDRGSVAPVPGLSLSADQYASQVVTAGTAYYSLVRSCPNRAIGMVVRSWANGRPSQVIGGGFYGLLSDGHGGVWGERHLSRPEAAISSSIVRLDRPGKPVVLPDSLNPIGLAGDQLVATGDPLRATPTESPVYVFDLTTRRYRLIGNSFSVSVSHGIVVWNSTACSDTGPCRLHTYDLATGRQTLREYHLPLESTFNGAVLSPDRRRLAFVLPQETSDHVYRSANTQATPANLAILDLRTGIVDPIPNLELPPGTSPAELAFSGDSKTLIIGLDSDGGTMLLSWRSGLSQPVLSGMS